jgi:hypothetical protein
MIGQLTELSMHAGKLGMTWEQLAWPQEEGSYEPLRAEALELLAEVGVEAKLPDTHDEYLAVRPQITPLISGQLSAARGKILGDTVALPFYFLNGLALRAALHAALHSGEDDELELVEDCLEDLGLDRDLARVLEREAGFIVLLEDEDDSEGPSVRKSDVIRAGGSFTVRVLEEFARKEQGLEGLQQAVVGLRDEVRDFREEYRATSLRLETLIAEGDAEIVGLLGEVKAALHAEGVDDEAAEELTAADPQTFWERLVRWVGGAQARDAAEAALWVALDFVPAGTGVKLGIKIASAVRKSLKAGAR